MKNYPACKELIILFEFCVTVVTTSPTLSCLPVTYGPGNQNSFLTIRSRPVNILFSCDFSVWVYITRIISSFVSKLGLRLTGKFHIIKYIRMLRMLKMTQSIFFIKLPGNNLSILEITILIHFFTQ